MLHPEQGHAILHWDRVPFCCPCDFLLRPDVAAANARAAETATANGAARKMLPNDPVLYPTAEISARGVWPTALPSAAQRYRDRLWTEIKAA